MMTSLTPPCRWFRYSLLRLLIAIGCLGGIIRCMQGVYVCLDRDRFGSFFLFLLGGTLCSGWLAGTIMPLPLRDSFVHNLKFVGVHFLILLILWCLLCLFDRDLAKFLVWPP